VILPWLYVTALLHQSALGLPGVLIAGAGLAGLLVALIAAVSRPSWRLLWLLLPLVVTHAYMQIVGIWEIGDHHETAAVSLYGLALFASLAGAGYAARQNRLAVAGAVVFALAYAAIACEASLFVFWNGFH
jgi:hypothetical protein